MPELFAKCCMCGKPLHQGDSYVRCTVSACNSGRLKLVFCSAGCWDAHLPTARHRKAAFTAHVAGQADPP